MHNNFNQDKPHEPSGHATRERVMLLLEKAPFKEAKTMKAIPHSYTLKKEWLRTEFEEVVKFIRKEGVVEYFWDRPFIYFYAHGYKYWTMGNPISETTLINRCLEGNFYNSVE